METEELKQLIHAVSSSKLQEFQYEESGIRIAMKKGISSSGKAADTGKITVETSEISENDPKPDTEEHVVRFSACRNLLCGAGRGSVSLCTGRGCREKGADACNRRGNETDE